MPANVARFVEAERESSWSLSCNRSQCLTEMMFGASWMTSPATRMVGESVEELAGLYASTAGTGAREVPDETGQLRGWVHPDGTWRAA